MESKKEKEEQLIEEIKVLKNKVAEFEKLEPVRKKIEEEFRLQREHLQLQIDRMPIGSIVWDCNFRVISWNPAAERIFGFTAQEAMGKHPYDFIVPKEAQLHVDKIWGRLLKGDLTANSTNENFTKDGRMIICEWTNTPLRRADGVVIGVLSMVQDITEIRRAEGMLYRQRLEQQIILDSVPAIIFYKDKENRFIRINKALADATGLPKEKIEGKSCFEVYPGYAEKYWEDDKEVMATGKPKRNIIEPLETTKGMILLQTDKIPYRDEEGNIVGIIGFSVDITKRKEATDALQESENKFRSLAEKSLVGIYLIQDGILKYINPRFSEIFGYTVEEIMDKMGPKDLAHPEDWPIAEENIRKRIAGETKSVHYSFRGLKKDKNIIYLEVYGTLTEYHNKPAIIGTLLNITERKKADEREKELIVVKAKAEVEKAKAEELRNAYDSLKELQERLIRSEKLAVLGKLAGIVGHELRNPLGVIRNSVYFLRMKLGKATEDEKIKKHLEILDEEVNDSDRIITDILAFAKIKEPRLVETGINDVIKISLKKVEIPRVIEVVTELKSDLPEILADAVQLERVFHNIILNSVEAMPVKGRLIVTSIKKGDFLEVHISDTGKGIPKGNLGRIFGPLFSTKAHGIGLGLSLCQEIIQGHKGKIEVESEVGKGTKFIIKLPVKNC